MYCHFCGKPLPENAAFCPHCGKALEEPTPTQKETHDTPPSPGTAAPTQVPPASDRPAAEPKCGQAGATGSQEGSHPTDEELIGRNVPYYLTQFAKLRQGEKASFNWAAFFLTFYHAAYRGPWKSWFSFMKIPLIGLIAGAVLGTVGALSVQLGVIAASSVVLLVFCILWFVWMIRYGFAFNRLYLAYVEKQRQAAQPKLGPSGKRLGIAIAIVIVFSILYTALSFATTMAVFGDLASGDSYEETLTLSEKGTEEPEAEVIEEPELEMQQELESDEPPKPEQSSSSDQYAPDATRKNFIDKIASSNWISKEGDVLYTGWSEFGLCIENVSVWSDEEGEYEDVLFTGCIDDYAESGYDNDGYFYISFNSDPDDEYGWTYRITIRDEVDTGGISVFMDESRFGVCYEPFSP